MTGAGGRIDYGARSGFKLRCPAIRLQLELYEATGIVFANQTVSGCRPETIQVVTANAYRILSYPPGGILDPGWRLSGESLVEMILAVKNKVGIVII